MNRRLALFLFLLLLLAACGGKKVTRIGTDTTVDLSGRWNDTDSRLVAQEMITDCLSHRWITDHLTMSEGIPVVTVGGIRNRTQERTASQTFISDIERAFINSGKVRTVSSKSERAEIRAERADQGTFASIETMKQMARELGADYIMTGEINAIEDREGRKQIVFYQTDLTLTSIESNEKVWIGQKKIKKDIKHPR